MSLYLLSVLLGVTTEIIIHSYASPLGVTTKINIPTNWEMLILVVTPNGEVLK